MLMFSNKRVSGHLSSVTVTVLDSHSGVGGSRPAGRAPVILSCGKGYLFFSKAGEGNATKCDAGHVTLWRGDWSRVI